MTFKELLKGWIKNHPAMFFGIAWLVASLLFFFLIDSIAATIARLYDLDMPVWLLGGIPSALILYLWKVYQSPVLKSKWTWLVLFVVGGVVCIVLEFVLAWFRYNIMYTAAGEIICSLLGGGLIVFTLYRKQLKEQSYNQKPE